MSGSWVSAPASVSSSLPSRCNRRGTRLVQVELGPLGNPTAVNSSNALRAAIGSY
jgi:hypothetical protein